MTKGCKMEEDKTTQILKNAILLEKRGQAFYAKVAQQTSGSAVKRFFEMLADEEGIHIRTLAEQFKAYQVQKELDPLLFGEELPSDIASEVLAQDIIAEISAADYEAAAISAAMSMEKRAIKLYSDRAADATDPAEKKLYQWLANWETRHLSFLADIDRELTENIWYDENFWPF
jgi:rubrerythrin